MRLVKNPIYNDDETYTCEYCNETFSTPEPCDSCCDIIEKICIKGDHLGINIPKCFIIGYEYNLWNIPDKWADIIKLGPEAEFYWETWDEILETAYLIDKAGYRWTLYQDGDLFAVKHEK